MTTSESFSVSITDTIFFCQQFSTAKIVLHGKAAIFDSIRIHQARNVVQAAHVNANEKLVHEYHLPVGGHLKAC